MAFLPSWCHDDVLRENATKTVENRSISRFLERRDFTTHKLWSDFWSKQLAHRACRGYVFDMRGRPTDYNEEIAEEICEGIATGGALYRLCEQNEDWPSERAIYRWLEANEEFRQKYARARERQADLRNDEIIVIADEATDANLARLRVDARKWQASKLAPKKYGDKLELGGPGGGPLVVQVVKFSEDDT